LEMSMMKNDWICLGCLTLFSWCQPRHWTVGRMDLCFWCWLLNYELYNFRFELLRVYVELWDILSANWQSIILAQNLGSTILS
jgi:hypothetical protein